MYAKDYQKNVNEDLKRQCTSTYEFSIHDIKKFILLLQKGVYPYEEIDDWEKFGETPLPHKEDFYSSLNMEDIVG